MTDINVGNLGIDGGNKFPVKDNKDSNQNLKEEESKNLPDKKTSLFSPEFIKFNVRTRLSSHV